MAGVFDLKKGAFDSSEAQRLYKAYDIALQGLRASHEVDQAVVQRLARSVVKVARTELDCLKNDGTIDPVRLAQRAILRMLQVSAPSIGAAKPTEDAVERVSRWARKPADGDVPPATGAAASSGTSNTSKIMQRLFDRTTFAKL